ncbi:MAG: LytR/AlgR family response regulator transcription factor [Janthinobacterium lividum]
MSVTALRTLIADDEPVARNRLRLLCEEIGGVAIAGMAVDGLDALRQIEALSPEVVLLDIAMPDLDGMGVARALACAPTPPAIIFCTAYDRHALAAFDVSAVDYLLKPISRERLVHAIEKARRYHGFPRTPEPPRLALLDHLWVPHRGAMLRIDISGIQRIDAEGDYVRLSTMSSSHMLHETMAAIEARLDPVVFVRLRRSVIVRSTEIKSLRHDGLGSWSTLLGDGQSVRIGPTYLPQVRARLKA